MAIKDEDLNELHKASRMQRELVKWLSTVNDESQHEVFKKLKSYLKVVVDYVEGL